jgi:adenylate kinase family enzyme
VSRRVVVVGGPGSGKSTVAAVLAQRLAAPHVELDQLWWDADWTPAGRAALRERLAHHIASNRWVVDGNYIDEVADLVWPRADTIVWLDLPRRVAVRRAVLRSASRWATRTDLWNGNRERLAVLSPPSVARLHRRWPTYSERSRKRSNISGSTVLPSCG